MNSESSPPRSQSDTLICPNLGQYWKLGKVKDSDQVILKASGQQFLFPPEEGYALRYFTGQFSLESIQKACQDEFEGTLDPNFAAQLLEKLIGLGILTFDEVEATETPEPPPPGGSQLKPCLEWIEHQDYWVLRNPENVTFLQVCEQDKIIIDQIGVRSPQAIIQEFCITPHHLKGLLQMLAATGMLVGTEPAKPRRGKFTPLQLLFFRIPLFNPDRFLNAHIDKIRWLFSQPAAVLLLGFLSFSAALGVYHRDIIVFQGQQLLQHYGASLTLPFVLCSAFVVTLHEFGHAFTLKHYRGIVPEIGLLFMMLIPAAYTNTSDSYCLPRSKRLLVVGAGILVQFILAAIGFWIWHFSTDGIWLHQTSFLLMAAAIFTLALNLNPVAKFDGYYLAVAATGINNLRGRAFGLYINFFTGKPIREAKKDLWILALYAPWSLLYIWFVFGFLFWRIFTWSFTNMPITALLLLAIWAVYYFCPRD